MKKTYIPSTPRSRKLKSVGGGTINVSGGSAQSVPVIEGHTHDNKIILDAITQLHLRILSSLNVDEDGALIVELSNIIKELDATAPTDENLFSALRTVLEIKARSISKTDPDTAQEIITFLKGIIASGTSKFDNIEVGNYTTGPLGAGAAIKMENGVSRMEVDQLDVRMRATFRELIIESLKHIGGQLILSPARMKCNKVVDGGTYYRCYFDTGDGKVSNEFVAGDQARCQVFTGSGVKMYWRLVTSVGTDWINLSKTDAISGSSIPEAGDDIVQLGNRTDTTRQNAQILSTIGSDAPSWKQYKGINAFSLEGKDTTVFSGTGNKIDGKTVFMSSGANVEDGINSKNSNYSSQPTSYKANDTWILSSDQTVNGIAYKSGEILTATQDSTTFVQAHWVKKVGYTDDTAVNDLQVGSRNIIKNRHTFYPGATDSASQSLTSVSSQLNSNGERETTITSLTADNNTLAYRYTFIQTFFTIPIKNQKYVFSFDYKTNHEGARVMLDWRPAFQNNPVKYLSNTNDEWVRGFLHINWSGTVAGTLNLLLFGVKNDVIGNYIAVRNFKLVEGNKGWDDSEAPEDVNVKIADTKLYIEYSLDGTSWHSTFQSNDVYMRQKTGVNGTWTGAIKIVGKDGTSVSIKGKVATSASLPSSASLGDGYIAEDTGHLWVWTGSWTDAGQIQGDNGANSYIHIAYADDSMGGGFSHNPSGKSWIGIYADFTAIDSDTPSDYTWMYAKGQQGDQGVSISSITPKYAVSTDGVNPPISWSNTVPAKAWNEYMWQYEIIAYSNSTTFETAKRVVSGINGEDGSDGIDGVDGADGISILSVTPEYAVNSNNATAPTTFYTTPPSRAAGQYLWVREKIEYSSGDPSYTSARVVTGDKGDTGASAPLLYLSASAQVMKCNPDNTPQAGQTISIEAKLQNVSGTATFVATPYNDAGTAQTPVTLGGTGNTRTLTNSQWLAAYKRIEVVATLGSLNDKVTIYRVADGATGSTGKGISGTEIKYQVGASGTTAPTGTWLTSVPTVPEGQFLWTRTITSYTDSTTTTSYSVSKQGVSGAAGKGISSTVITYQANSSGTVVPTGTWSGTIPSVSENQYLWTRTVITYTDSSTSTSYSVGKMGAKGDAGQNAIVGLLTNESVTLQANNAGVVSSFTPANGEFWVYNGVTKVTSGITFSKVSETGCTAAITSAGAYSVSAMSADNATVVLRAVYSGVTIDKVLTLSKSRAGADGVSITGVDVEFAKNTTPETAPTTGWTTTAQTLLDGEQLWTRTKTTYSAGNPTYSTPANITPKKGDTGAVGQGIDSVTEEYAISTSKTVQPTTGWSTTQPAWIQGQYIWSRVKVVYKNPAQTIYTGYAVSSEWEAVNNLQIGGRNYYSNNTSISTYRCVMSNRNTGDTINGFKITSIDPYTSNRLRINNAINSDGWWTLSLDVRSNDASDIILDIADRQDATQGESRSISPEWKRVTCTVNISNYTPTVYNFVDIGIFPFGDYSIEVRNIKIERGTKATDWSPAPEDVQAAIDAEKNRINDILSDNVADPSEKQYLSNLWQEIYAEYPRIWAQANDYSVDKSNYEAKYTALNNLLSPVLANLTTNSTVSGASIRTAFSQYYDAKTFLLNNITNKVNATAADAQVKANALDYLKQALQGATEVSGGLVGTNVILLKTLAGLITGGLSGLANDNIGFWTGGTYQDALDSLAEIILRKDGSGQLAGGDIAFAPGEPTRFRGMIELLSSLGKVGVIDSGLVTSGGQISEDVLETLAQLAAGYSVSITPQSSWTDSYVAGILGEYAHAYTQNIVVTEDSSLEFWVSFGRTYTGWNETYDIYVEDVNTGVLEYTRRKFSSTLNFVGGNYSIPVRAGTYKIHAKITGTGGFQLDQVLSVTLKGKNQATNITAVGFKQKTKIGIDGFFSYWGEDNYLYYQKDNGFKAKVPANKWDTYGILLSATVAAGGGWAAVSGAKGSTTPPVNNSTGKYTVYHTVGHTNYQVSAVPSTASRTCHIVSKGSTNFVIEWRTVASTPALANTGFDFHIVGNNYA